MNAREFSELLGCPSCRRKSVTPTAVFVRACPTCRETYGGTFADRGVGRGWVSARQQSISTIACALRGVVGWPAVVGLALVTSRDQSRVPAVFQEDVAVGRTGPIVYNPSWLRKLQDHVALALSTMAQDREFDLDAEALVVAHHALALCCRDHDLGQACAAIIDGAAPPGGGMYTYGNDNDATLETWTKVQQLCRAARVR